MRSYPSLLAGLFIAVTTAGAYAARTETEDYKRAPLPPGFQVVATELEGPVFADANGKTVYRWPVKHLRNGDAGEVQNKPTCEDKVYKVSSGLMSPYPAGLELPDADARAPCTAFWPPVFAAADAKPVGKWTVIDRPDGRRQWAYDGWALYTSILDKQPGDVLGGSPMIGTFANAGAPRLPMGPEPNVPSQFEVVTTMLGRMVTLRNGWSVYVYDGDGRNTSKCAGTCLDEWVPVLAPAYARPLGEWTIFERAPGVTQWAFKGKPIYQHPTDRRTRSHDGGDVPGWSNVYTQRAPAPPSGLALKDTMIGLVLADANGKTVYRYQCYEDAPDQPVCDTPEAPQVYRLAVCGAFDVERCLKTFPYVTAPANAKSGSRLWTVLTLDPKTGKRAAADQPGAQHVWAFRGRPVYTFAGDTKSTDMHAHNWGEFNGEWNGYKAMVYRDLFTMRAETFESK